MNRIFFLLCLCSCFPALAQQDNAEEQYQKTTEYLTRLVDEGYLPSVVYGLHSNGNTEYFTYGLADKEKGAHAKAETVYEIGSITKTFTALLAQLLVNDGILEWNDPLSKYLPDSIPVLEKDGKEVTLWHLATHTSGLSRVPDNMQSASPYNPYAEYGVNDLYRYLQDVKLESVPGEQTRYSNTGFGLLGHIASIAAEKPYKELLEEKILQPLQLESASIDGVHQSFTMAQGYLNGKPVENWDFKVIAPAGSLEMHAKDLMHYLKAQMGLVNTPLHQAMQQTQQVQVPHGKAFTGLAWQAQIAGKDTLYWHNGGTGGFRSFAAFLPEQKKAVVLLTNTYYDIDPVAMFGIGQLDSLPVLRKQVEVPAQLLEKYTGKYQLAPNFSIDVTRQGQQLFAQATNQPKIPIYPETESRFFFKAVDAQLQFNVNEQGSVEGLVLHQNGRKMPGQKIE